MIYLYVELVLLVSLIVTAPFQLWCDYIGVMNAKRVRDTVGLTKAARLLGSYVLARGYFLDFLCNAFWMTLILRELPRELTVTKRLRRHIEQGTSHAGLCLAIRKNLLDYFDPAGIHN